jgi:endo-1,4-beta-D-glucanase Y
MMLITVHRAAIMCLLAIFAVPPAFAIEAPSTLWPLWDQYKRQFLKADGRIVDWDAGARTTSEGQAYALFFSLVANDRPAFDCILAWTETHLAQGSLRNNLPAWLWTPSRDNAGAVADANSAADADLWTAYTLIQAGRVWRNPDYTALGRALAERIAREEVDLLSGKGYMLLPGRDGFRPEPGAFVLNPSYMPPQLLASLSHEFPEGPWRSIAAGLPELLSAGIGHGFAMDWVAFRAGSGFSATSISAPQLGGAPGAVPAGSYDAVRVYLWAGMLDPAAAGRQALLQNLSGMQSYLRDHPIPPERVAASGAVIDANGPVGFSAAVIPLLTVFGDRQPLALQHARLDQSRNSFTGLYGPGQRYYDQVLALFAEGWSDAFFSFDPHGQLSVRWKKP